ncbi:hypothetical protein F8S13_23120 [Chloroflexia bacterium SDU3-3]|nr:hypothetical protein F8S13_23120 [Chloroflexia bacterium SDU3-3]
MFYKVKYIEWEYGKDYGNVFYPLDGNIRDKVLELDEYGLLKEYSFLISVIFENESLYVAFTVGHEKYSFLEFMYGIDRESSRGLGPFYVVNDMGDPDEIIPIYYMSSYTEVDTAQMLPKECIFDAVFQFCDKGNFPGRIRFNDDCVNMRFVS